MYFSISINREMKNSTLIKALAFNLLFFSTNHSCFAQLPDPQRFTVREMTGPLDEPMEMTFLPEGKVLIAERKGIIKLLDTKTNETSEVAQIKVNTKYKNKQGVEREAEEGLMGIVADPDFANNHWLYLYYSDPEKPRHILTRWDFVDDQLVDGSEKILLEVNAQRFECCHTGGGMAWDKSGNLYLTVGNNTSNGNSEGYAPLDERPGQEFWDDQRGAGNTNDLRGSVLRIKPLPDGTYRIPEGNLFPPDMPKTRPEIYAKGARNPWRPTIDSKTGYLYWGEVGPDASHASDRGPVGYDEFNQAKKAGFFGWPYFAGPNEAYADYDFETKTIGPKFSLVKPINDSPNNTGLRELPSPTPAFIWYPYGLSDTFPQLGVSGRSATGVAVYHKSDFVSPARPWPDYYEGKLMIGEFMRGWIMAVTLDQNSDYVSMERIVPDYNFSSLIDMEYGPDGDLYVLLYGSGWFRGTETSRLVRVEYNSGNRNPQAKIDVSKKSGSIPLKIKADGSASTDADKDKLTYNWQLFLKDKLVNTASGNNADFELAKVGEYTLKLKVTDENGDSDQVETKIIAGNEAPVVDFLIENSNQTFYKKDKSIPYEVIVNDREDGNLDFAEIQPSQVSVNIDYVPESFDRAEIASNYAITDRNARFNSGFRLIGQNDCSLCHAKIEKSIGPSFAAIAEKYKNEPQAVQNLAAKVINGGEGVWGDHAMSAHPQLSNSQAEAMVSYILSVTENEIIPKSLPVSGTYNLNVPAGENGFGGFAFRIAYTDQGAKKVPAIFQEKIRYLSYPYLQPWKWDSNKGTEYVISPLECVSFTGKKSWIKFSDIDLTGISSLDLLVQASKKTANAGGIIEIRAGSPDGELLGKTGFLEVEDVDRSVKKDQLDTKEKQKKIRKYQEFRFTQQAAEYFLGLSRLENVSLEKHTEPVDLYFVCLNPEAADNQITLYLSGIEFNFEK